MEESPMTARQRRLRVATDSVEATVLADRLLPTDACGLKGEGAERLRDTILESCDELLRVSAGLNSLLDLLEMRAGECQESNGLHALLSPLKLQLDEAVDRIQELY